MTWLDHFKAAIDELELGINAVEGGDAPYGMPPESIPMFIAFFRDQIASMRKYAAFYEENAPRWEAGGVDFTQFTGEKDAE